LTGKKDGQSILKIGMLCPKGERRVRASLTPTKEMKEDEMAKWKLLLGSRKFWAAFVGLLFMVIQNFDPNFNVPETETVAFVSMLAAYILGVALEDGLSRRGA